MYDGTELDWGGIEDDGLTEEEEWEDDEDEDEDE